MVKFHGDLLLGGLALRNLHGTMTSKDWTGRFLTEKGRESILDLLLLDDGRTGQVIVTDWEAGPDDSLAVEFRSCN